MKINSFLLIAIILLAIISFGAVSAEDNLTAGDGENTLSEAPQLSADDGVLADGAVNLVVECPNTARFYEDIPVNVTITAPEENISGMLNVYDLDDMDPDDPMPIYSWDISSKNSCVEFPLAKMGVNKLRFVFEFDDEYSGHGNLAVDKKITIKDYVIFLRDNEMGYEYGEDAYLDFAIPFMLNKDIKIRVNNKKEYVLEYFEDYGGYSDFFYVDAKYLVYGKNNITITYPGDKTNKAHTFYETITVGPKLEFPEISKFNSGDKIVLTLPKDANGKLVVSIDGNNQTPVQAKDGKAAFTIPAIALGGHEIGCSYIDDEKYGASYSSCEMTVIPKVIVPSIIGADGGNIEVEMPAEYNGDVLVYGYYWDSDGEYRCKNFTRANLTDGKATLPIKFNYDYEYGNNDHEFNVIVSWGEDSFEDTFGTYVVNARPEWDLSIIPNPILKYSGQHLTVEYVPEELTSNYSLVIDGANVKITDQEVATYIYFDAGDLEYGKHNFTLKFLGDGYYKPTSYSGSFVVEKMGLEVPEVVEIGECAGIDVFLPGDLRGKLTVKVDGKSIFSRNVDADDISVANIEIWTEIENVKAGEHKVEATYTDSKNTIKKTAKFKGDYNMGVSDVISYGGSQLNLSVPSPISSKVTVSIDGVDKKVTVMSGNTAFVSDTADLSVGEHTAVLKYAGDKVYPAKTVEVKFNVTPIVDFTGSTLEKGDGLTLIMPDDAKGNLTVYVKKGVGDYWVFYNQNAAGKTFVTFDNLTYGHYRISLNYTGSDYEVNYNYGRIYDDSFEVTINPEFTFPKKVLMGESATVSVHVNENNSKIRVFDNLLDFDKTVYAVDEVATVTLPALTKAVNHFNVRVLIDGDNGGGESFWGYIDIKGVNPINAKDTTAVFSNTAKYSVKMKDLAGNAIASGKVTFYILDGKKQILKKTVDIKNGTATLSYKITQGVKTYTIKTVYNKATISKKLTVKHLVSLKKVTVKKSARKLVLKAVLGKVNGKYLKSKKVTFKFNGKTYKVKTNKKGVAKVTIKKQVLRKLKTGKKVTYQATYLKDTVKMTVKVKR